MSTRLSARIDDELARKIELIRARTHQSITDIVRASIEAYYEQFRERESGAAARLLEETGFVGCAEGEPDLSTNYKERLGESLDAKVGER